MAKILLYICTFTLNVLVIYAAVSAFDDILDDVTTCEGKCMKSFGTVNNSENTACSRGCRLYTVTRFITADGPQHTNTIDDNGSSPAKILCHQSCVEAYNETSSLMEACKMGCDLEESATEKKVKVEEETGPSIHLLKPLMEIREVTSKVVGMLRIVQSSLTTYFMRDDNSVVAVEGPVHVMVQLNPNLKNDNVEDSVRAESIDAHNRQVLKEKIDTAFAQGDYRTYFASRRLGCLIMISLMVFFVLFGCVLTTNCIKNAKKQKIHEISKQLKNQIPSHVLPVKLVRPEDLTKLTLMDEEESSAPGLQTKIKLPDNTVI